MKLLFKFCRRQTLQDPYGNTSTTIYDALNRVIGTFGPRGDHTTYTYGGFGQPT